jgi:hypothetical protein
VLNWCTYTVEAANLRGVNAITQPNNEESIITRGYFRDNKCTQARSLHGDLFYERLNRNFRNFVEESAGQVSRLCKQQLCTFRRSLYCAFPT